MIYFLNGTHAVDAVNVAVPIAIRFADGRLVPAAPRHRNLPGPHHFDNPTRAQDIEQAVDFFLIAGRFDDDRPMRDVDDVRAKNTRELVQLREGARVRVDLDEREIAHHGRRVSNVLHVDDVDEFRQIRSRTLTRPKTHHHVSVFFYDCGGSDPGL